MVRREWRAAFGFSASIVFTYLSGRADRPSSRSPICGANQIAETSDRGPDLRNAGDGCGGHTVRRQELTDHRRFTLATNIDV